MHEGMMELFLKSSHISGGNAAYVEDLYEQFLVDANSVPEEWRNYFEQLPVVQDSLPVQDIPHSTIRQQFELLAKQKLRPVAASLESHHATEYERKQVRVLQLISAYRQRGHQKANLDPLGLWQRPVPADLDLNFHHLTQADYDTLFQTGVFYIGKEEATLKEIHEALEKTYCQSVGSEFMHMVSTKERTWLQQRMDSVRSAPEYSAEAKLHLLERLTAAEGLEKYLGSKYPGTKRFGLEGGESLIPMMDALIQRAGSGGTKEVVIGMAHRGRLNVLVNILGKNPSTLFDEFEGKVEYKGSADVKYHQGFSSNVMTEGGEMHLAMAFNPSHLEIVSPVVEGSVRARQDRRKDDEGGLVLPVCIHGDAAFAGQGVVMETFQMSQTRAYGTGGTVHIVINNQVGFTTSKQEDARSTEYCTDIAKMVQAPIFHVNGDDPEAVLFVTNLAVDFRQTFKKDVVIDLICYRRRGHNEADEPSGTQPLMYKKIKTQKTTRDLYAERLIAQNILSKEGDQELINDYREALDTGKHVAKSLVMEPNSELFVDWTPYLGHEYWSSEVPTSLPVAKLQELGNQLLRIPEGFEVQRQVQKVYQDRALMAAGGEPVNWGFAELLAYASLIDQGLPIRLTGQDVGRGTFSHRHAALHSQKDASTYVPLQHLSDDQPNFTIHDSFLSEEAVLAFEYGYATTAPSALVIWEAQFGDFANGAQVVIDQFITSGEHKWSRVCGLTMLLPHGYEGQGPEHSSARLERFLQLCAEHNIQVVVPSTPAQVFHMMRRQAMRMIRKPLVVMSPKSLLRHKEVTSTLDELANGRFECVLAETDNLDPAGVDRLVICSGKLYYELRAARRDNNLENVAIIRLEQLYPFPEEDMSRVLAPYTNLKEVVWAQEEPQNQGAWYSSQHHMRNVIAKHDKNLYLEYAGRSASASPAAGYMALHVKEQAHVVNSALGLE